MNQSGINEVLFSINEYDFDGDCTDEALFLHIGDHIRLRFKDTSELIEFRDRINNILEEISEWTKPT